MNRVNWRKILGMGNEERDNAFLEAHKNVINDLERYKNGELRNIELIQNDLMNAAGYTIKKVNYCQTDELVSVEFSGFRIVPTGNLRGAGKDELEAICDACSNFIENPFKYNFHSEKYIKKIKEGNYL